MESVLLQRQPVIRTPDQRLRVFVSSTLEELKAERLAAKKAITSLHLTPVMFELGARPHPPRDVYSSYLIQSHVFVGIYGDRYGWIVPGMDISGLEDEFRLAADHPRLIYIKRPAQQRDERLKALVDEIKNAGISCKFFSEPDELSELIGNDLALLLTERFEEGGRIVGDEPERARVPAAATPLIGREEQVEAIKELLRPKTTRLVTLTGAGGIGKTRLAMEVAQQMGPAFRDGVYFVPLSSVSNADLVLSTVVQNIFPGELGGQTPLELLKRSFSDQQVLLVLDNFEQVIDAAPSIAELAQVCPGLKMLVTSREVLRLSGEQEFRVPMLTLPEVKGVPLPSSEVRARVGGSAAVQLFVQRAQAIDQGFALTEQNAATIAGICVRLDGCPLAIELAAARIRILTPQAILKHLDRSLAVLSSGTRDLPERHRTLTATIDWSYQLLSTEEQRLLCALSVFTGGCTLEAANVVTSNGPVSPGEPPRIAMYLYDPAVAMEPFPEVPFDLIERMESLVAKNLVYCEERAGVIRFQLYVTIRDYAAQRAAENGIGLLAENHCAYFLRLAEQLWPTLRGREAIQSYQQLDQELDNLRQALAWALTNAPASGLRIALALGEYWDTRGMPDEQIQWTDAVLKELRAGDPVPTAIAKMELARAAFRRSDLERFAALTKEVSATAAELGNTYLIVDALMRRGKLAAYGIGMENIVPLMKEGLAMSKRSGYTIATIEFLHNLAAVANFGGRPAEAIALSDESLELATRLGATRWEAISYAIRGFAQLSLGQLDASDESLNAALQCCKRFMDNAQVIYPLLGKAQLALARGSTAVGVELMGAVERFCERKGTTIIPAVLQLVAVKQNAVKAQVGVGAYERLRGIGRELQLREAMELAERRVFDAAA